MAGKKKTYEPMPEVPAEVRAKYLAVLEVLSGKTTVSEAARDLGLARNYFQTVMHRGLAGLIEGLTPKPKGRPGRPAREVELEAEVERLQRENERLEARVGMIDRLLGVASEMVKGRVKGLARERRPKTTTGTNDPDDAPERLASAQSLRAMGLGGALAAAVIGVASATVRRWSARARAREPLVRRRGPGGRATPGERAVTAVSTLVRELGGQVGAEALRRSVTGVSRRQAGAIKKWTLTEMERERIANTERVIVTRAGILRGLDQLYVATTRGPACLLVSADGTVPYRTSIEPIERYDGPSVAAALEADLAGNGAPLVWRRDRARSHSVDEVNEILRAYGVLALYGPPRLPRFYGQLERQNREHRAWLNAAGVLDRDELEEASERMRCALNGRWRRRTLDWKTAEEAWKERPPVQEDRTALREEVQDQAARLRRHLGGKEPYQGLIERLAIEQVLTKRGYLRQEAGGWC